MKTYPRVSITEYGIIFEIAPGVFTNQLGAEELEKTIIEEIKTKKKHEKQTRCRRSV
jgi:hypothetical protein